MTLLTQETYAGFYYTPAGILDNLATPLEHLALGQAHGVVANGTRKKLDDGTVVVNYAKSNDKYYAQVGISLGNALTGAARSIWPAWANEASVVFEVVWVTRMVEVPAEYFVNQRQHLPLEDVAAISHYVLRHQG